MWDSSHTHTHHTINQIRVSQSPPLKSLMSLLGPTLWGSVLEPTQDYQVGFDTICNDPRKNASHICVIPQKDQSLLRLLVVVNKAQIYLVNTRCGTHHTPTHIHNQSNQGITTSLEDNCCCNNKPPLHLKNFSLRLIFFLFLPLCMTTINQ